MRSALLTAYILLPILAISQVVRPDLQSKASEVVSAQVDSQVSRDVRLEWTGVSEIGTLDERSVKLISFEGARWKDQNYLPHFARTIELQNGATSASIEIQNVISEPVSANERKFLSEYSLPREFEVSSVVKRAGERTFAVLMVEPIRQRGGQIEKLLAFDIEVTPIASAARGSRSNKSWKSSSVLSSGSWFRVAVVEEGIYKVTYNDLQTYGLGVNDLSSDQIRVYGTKAGMISPKNSNKRPDDLDQISILVEDGGDGIFDRGDHFLFYAEDQTTWELNGDQYRHTSNPYSDSVFYFISVDGSGASNRVLPQGSIGAATTATSTYDHFELFEEDLVNLIQSGRTWYGAQLSSTTLSIDIGFDVPNIDKNSPIYVRSRMASRSVGIPGVSVSMSLPNEGGLSTSEDVGFVGDFYGALYAVENTLELTTIPTSSNVLTKLELNLASNPLAQAWIDFAELNARRQIVMNDAYLSFRDSRTVSAGAVAEYTVSASQAITIWDVTDITNVVTPTISGGVVNGFRFKQTASELREFVAFTESAPKKPYRSGRVENQNIHALSGIEYVIIAHPSFRTHAQRLADLHQNSDGLASLVVTPQQIYNEFSGGAQDITAIKEFMRKLYFEADSLGSAKPKYLLLFGDASYDYKDKISGNSNFVPTHQMRNSLSPTGSIASDDYYGLLNTNEGESPQDFLDIGIGRLPARSKKEAEDMVNKITRYANTSSSLGEWRNKIAFTADDADPRDGHTFMVDFELLGGIIDDNAPEYIIQKLYMDSYKQQAGAGGERYPDGADAISGAIERGVLMMYYIGHGGELGWAHERILDVSTINRWVNTDRLPLLITATCEFARYDDPRRTSAGEYCLINPSGGAIALLTTTRAVYASPNLTLTSAFTDAAFDKLDQGKPRLGDLMLETKIQTLDTNSGAALNSRSFALLGDPALRLAYPEMSVELTSVPDTIKALEKVRIEGYVADNSGAKMEDFNGIVYPSIFDKESEQQSLNNDGEGPYDYEEWKNLVFRGKSSVTNGEFALEFYVPKDIGKQLDIGRINLYATNGKVDALGDDREFIIGSISDNPIQDDQGPEADLYMNDQNFVFGGLTNESPDLYAEIEDDFGINMVGSGVGHDITAVLDGNTSNTIVLNDFYEADIDSYQSGKIRYPFDGLSEGKHTLKLQVWDVNNNPSDAYTEFIVANDERFALEHVLNYPNPFTTNTDFYFEHNKPGLELDVTIEVFTVAGKLVKTIDGQYLSEGFRVGPINWDGLDQYGDQLARGVYLYRVSVRTPVGESVEEYERLVLLR